MAGVHVYFTFTAQSTYPRMWTGRSVSPRTCLRRRRIPRSALCRLRKIRFVWKQLGWRASMAEARRRRATYFGSLAREAGGRGPSEGRGPGLRPRRRLARRAWWWRCARVARSVRARRLCQGSRLSRDWARVLGSGQGAPARHWPGARPPPRATQAEGPATSARGAPPPHPPGRPLAPHTPTTTRPTRLTTPHTGEIFQLVGNVRRYFPYSFA